MCAHSIQASPSHAGGHQHELHLAAEHEAHSQCSPSRPLRSLSLPFPPLRRLCLRVLVDSYRLALTLKLLSSERSALLEASIACTHCKCDLFARLSRLSRESVSDRDARAVAALAGAA